MACQENKSAYKEQITQSRPPEFQGSPVQAAAPTSEIRAILIHFTTLYNRFRIWATWIGTAAKILLPGFLLHTET